MNRPDPTPRPNAGGQRTDRDCRRSRLPPRLSWLLLSLLLSSSLGCASIAESLARKLASRTLEREFELYLQRTDAFLGCIGSTGGVCPSDDALTLEAPGPPPPLDTSTPRPPSDALTLAESAGSAAAETAADMARKVLNHDVQGKINDLYSLLRGSRRELLDALPAGPRGTPTLAIGTDELEGYLRDVEAATLVGGWEALASEGEAPGALVQPRDRARRQYIRAYLRAYFRNGRFYQATISASELREKLRGQIKETLPLPDSISDEDLDRLVQRLFGEYGNEAGKIFGRIETQGFVTRGGEDHKFPAVQAAIRVGGNVETTISDIDFIAVGSDLIRVYLHAVFDAHDRIPSVSNATGASAVEEAVRLAVNDPETTNVDETEFERIEGRAAQVEGAVATGVGRLVRGISLFSLNNEALATALETAVGVASRKFAEKAAWCYYACELDSVTGSNALSLEGSAAASEPIRFRIVVTSGGDT